tara:strand:- start:1521 stop:2429 length:909 start_codon:yes stop_codon:yes gene_type:complete
VIELPSGVEINSLIDDIKSFSWEASEVLLYYAQILKNSSNKINILKNDNYDDPVTLADLKVNELIIQKINERYKNINWNILSEENVKSEPQFLDKNKDWTWILDPLDGTKDFIQGTSNYAMHLALNYKNKPFIGVVLIPDKNELWLSYGKKVWCQKKDGSIIKPKLSKVKSLQEMVLVTSKNHRNNSLNKLIEKINFVEVKIMGSIGCKVASLVRGESDIYICLSMPGKSSPKDWDFAAPEAILKAAGGAITNINKDDLLYGENNFKQEGIIIASNNSNTHKGICDEIRKIITKYDLYPDNS